MRKSFVTLRRGAVIIVAAASVVGAMILIWNLVSREHIERLSTLQLLAMLALFLLPGATYAAWELDRRAVRERARAEENDLFETPDGIEFADEPTSRADQGPVPGYSAGIDRPRPSHRRRLTLSKSAAKRG